jgi:hypothetical protein
VPQTYENSQPDRQDLAQTLHAEAAEDFITILETLDGKPLCKVHRPDGVTDFADAYEFKMAQSPVSDLADLAMILGGMAPNECAVHGGIVPGTNKNRARRISKDKPGNGLLQEIDRATLEVVPHRWLALDVDKIEPVDAAGRFDYVADPERAVRCILDKLPAPFESAACFWQLTSGAGFKPTIRMRLWFWMSHPLPVYAVKSWMQAVGAPVDTMLYNPVQPIYRAAPMFDGVDDPVKTRSGMVSGGLVTPPDTIPTRERHQNREVPDGFVFDAPVDIARARQRLDKHQVWADGAEGNDDWGDAAFILDLGVTAETGIKLAVDHGADPAWAALKFSNAQDHGQNREHLGCKSFAVECPIGAQALAAGKITLDEAISFWALADAARRERGASDWDAAQQMALAELQRRRNANVLQMPGTERVHASAQAEGKAPTDNSTQPGNRHSRFAGYSPLQGDRLPDLTYFDRHKLLPRVPGGCYGTMVGAKSSQKSGVALKLGMDAVLEKGAKVLYVAGEGGHGGLSGISCAAGRFN